MASLLLLLRLAGCVNGRCRRQHNPESGMGTKYFRKSGKNTYLGMKIKDRLYLGVYLFYVT
jgi:hypothetical protein